MTEIQDNAFPPDDLGSAFEAATVDRAGGRVLFTVCAILVFSVIAFGAVDSWATGVLSVVSGGIVTVWFFDSWKKRAFVFSDSGLQLPIAGLILVGLVQLLPFSSAEITAELLPIPAVSSFSLAPYATRMAVVQLVVYLVFFGSALIAINNRGRLQKIVVTIIIFGSLAAFYGILQRLASAESIYGVRPALQAIPFASFVNQHHFAALMEMTIAIPLALLFGKATRRDKRLLLIIAVMIMGMAVLFTSSRGGLLGLLGVIGFIVTANLLVKPSTAGAGLSPGDKTERFRRIFALIGGGLALLLVLVGLVLLLGGGESLMRGTGLESSGQDLSNGRIHFWGIALQILRDHPIIGSGLDSFGTVFTRYDTWNGQFRVEQAHNDYLQILADAGILGFICTAGFIILLFKQGLRRIAESSGSRFRQSTSIGALAGCFGILLHSFFDFPLRTPANAFVFLTLTVLATAGIDPSNSRDKSRTGTGG